ncbi:MAG: metacaspase [Verrucomicrobiota bacterium]
MKILLVHGVGHAERPDNQPWEKSWEDAITAGIQYFDHGLAPTYEHFDYDNLFSGKLNLLTDLAAAARLGFAPVGAAISEAADAVTGWFRPKRGLSDWTKPIAEAADGWHAGMVAEWDENKQLRAALRKKMADAIKQFDPEAIMAHSLGSIICYDTFRSPEGDGACSGRYLVTFGSQIANPFLKAAHFQNKIRGVNQKYWFHLFNKSDPVLAHRIIDLVPNFEEVSWDDKVAGHDAITDPNKVPGHAGYLQRDLTWERVYRTFAEKPRSFVRRSREFRQKTTEQGTRRALLIGINNYPDVESRLEGCVNDVFLMSSVLQEIGFKPDEIRVVLDERATRSAIRERIDWLLDATADGQERVLYYSGHGAQLPDYNAAEKIDHVDECLAPYDFHWTQDSAITDDDFVQYYSALPYDAKFFTIFDCCHSGGMTRDGARKIRAMVPPDDIRHRMLKWNMGEQMWEERDLRDLNPDFGGGYAVREKFMGRNGSTKKLGSAMSLREHQSKKEYDKIPRARRGPYMPVVFAACQESAFAYEYHHGAIGHGLFTYALAKDFRKVRRSGISFNELRDLVNATMKRLHYEQVANVEGPRTVCAGPILGTPRKERRVAPTR